MCFCTQTFGNCGHTKKIALDPPQCTCATKTSSSSTPPPNSLDDTPTEDTKKKKRGGVRGDFKGELKPLKDGWCNNCLIEQKAKAYDQLASGIGIGGLLNQVINVKPVEKQSKTVDTKSLEVFKRVIPTITSSTADKTIDVFSSSSTATTPTSAAIASNLPTSITAITSSTPHPDYPVPKWSLKWKSRTRSEMKRSIRELKMELVDEIRVLRLHAKTNGADMAELDDKIKAQTCQRRDTERAAREAKLKRKEQAGREREAVEKRLRNEKMNRKLKDFADYVSTLEGEEGLLYAIELAE